MSLKDKIIIFIIGLLIGAVIATGAFFVYTKATTTCNTNSNNQMQMPGGNPPSMPSGQNSVNGQPPEKPDGENGQNPEKSSESNAQDSNQKNN